MSDEELQKLFDDYAFWIAVFAGLVFTAIGVVIFVWIW